MKAIHLYAVMLLAATGGDAQSQSAYPSKPIRIVVPYVAGGAADITARIVGQMMAEGLRVPVIIDNKPGANGMIGTDAVAKAAPDGYTLVLLASGPLVVNPVLYAKVPYDPVKDFSPISLMTSYQYALTVPTASPIKNLAELVATAKAKPGQLSYGSTGVGGGGHLAGVMFGLMSGAEFTHVPYKGAAPALADLLGGTLSFTFDTVVTAAPFVRSGKLRAFAVSGPRRASSLPGLPTMQEVGYKGFDITQFQGLLAPAKTPAAIIDRLHDEVTKALKVKEVADRLATEGGYEIVGSTPAAFGEHIRSDLDRYGKLVKDANIQPE
ncbi:MAG: tripartite tricarboxylate transporter substrate binding protein [Variovorax sp.]|nr:MAG: tripartite tricarboxylate transporter substrate binding protein [Variovorax sp.]